MTFYYHNAHVTITGKIDRFYLKYGNDYSESYRVHCSDLEGSHPTDLNFVLYLSETDEHSDNWYIDETTQYIGLWCSMSREQLRESWDEIKRQHAKYWSTWLIKKLLPMREVLSKDIYHYLANILAKGPTYKI